jgi:hypothetical protein
MFFCCFAIHPVARELPQRQPQRTRESGVYAMLTQENPHVVCNISDRIARIQISKGVAPFAI